MNERTFDVPVDTTIEFAELLSEYSLEGLIIGSNEGDVLLIKVQYEPEEDSQAILEMIEYIENLNDENQEEVDDA